MRYNKCDVCENVHIPKNDSIIVEGILYCKSCLEKRYADSNDLVGLKIQYDFDSTVCTYCSKDFHDVELPKISDYYICPDCKKSLESRNFPNWVKLFFISIIAIVIFAFFWNKRYYDSYKEINKANSYYIKGDFENAYLHMNIASTKVPEVEDLKYLSIYFNGVSLLYSDKNSAAYDKLTQCKDKLSPDFNINSLLLQAKIGLTFDDKDYKGFLDASKEFLAIDTTFAISWATVASAYSCLYVSLGDKEYENQTNYYLQRAKSIDNKSSENLNYYNMIEYRIFAKKIVTRKEFNTQFPKGWTKQ